METVEGRGVCPVLALVYLRGLPDTSLTTALMRGGQEHYGWGQDRHIQADLYDAISLNTRATGNWKKPPDIPAWPRPEVEQEETKSSTVVDLWNYLNRR